MILTRITARAANQNCLRRNCGGVGYCRPVVSGHPKEYGWPVSWRSQCPSPLTLMDSSGEEYDPPTISASKTLESRYSCVFLVAPNVLCREELVGEVRYSFLCTSMLCFVVTGLDSGHGVESSGGNDVFVCEAALDTPAQKSDVV